MTENSKKAAVPDGLPGMAAFHPGVSAQLREFYQSVQEEGIPQRFLELLERLDMAERRAGENTQNRETAR
jgi:Anti-sigma factor NepR